MITITLFWLPTGWRYLEWERERSQCCARSSGPSYVAPCKASSGLGTGSGGVGVVTLIFLPMASSRKYVGAGCCTTSAAVLIKSYKMIQLLRY